MPTSHPKVSAATRAHIARGAGELATAAAHQMETQHDWYRRLSARDRSWVGLVAQSGIRAFLTWLSTDGTTLPITADVFGTAPQELTRSITLRQTLDLVRTVVDVVEREVADLASPTEAPAVREAVLLYSREIAFAAAEVYAQAAEARGAWDARLESLVVDSVLRGEADDSIRSRAAALGWGTMSRIAVVVGSTPAGSAAAVVEDLHRMTGRLGVQVLAAVQGPRLVCITGEVDDALRAASALVPGFGPGPVVVGPVVPHLFASGRSARAALSGHAAAPAWPEAPRPTRADDLLAERVLIGDQPARAALHDRIHRPLVSSGGGHLLETATAYLEGGQGLEGTARSLFVHPNTVRYRLGSISRLTGYDLTDPHDALTVRLALALARLPRTLSAGTRL